MLHRVFLLALSFALPLAGACSPRGSDLDPNASDDGGAPMDPNGGGRCLSLGCRVARCTPITKTTLTGTVNIPAGNLPLYGARVFIPSKPLAPIEHGPSCDRCDSALSGAPVAETTTDAAGNFILEDVPYGADIPLVVQVGKWRRQLTVDNVPKCTQTRIDPDKTRLPRSQFEGDLPQIALTTGGADALECLMRKLGLDDSEITTPDGTGHVHLYAGAGGTNKFSPDRGGADIPPASPWWDSLEHLKQYDVILHSCEGLETSTNKSMSARQALKDYIDIGGRVFASHWHNYWVEQGVAPLPTLAQFNHRQPPSNPAYAKVDMSFARGKALASWLVNVGGSQPPGGELALLDARNTVQSVDPLLARAWITLPFEGSIQYVSFDTPLEAPAEHKCGRMVLSDIHVSSDWLTSPLSPYPLGCQTEGLSAQEKALIFMLFDLSNCLAPVIG